MAWPSRKQLEGAQSWTLPYPAHQSICVFIFAYWSRLLSPQESAWIFRSQCHERQKQWAVIVAYRSARQGPKLVLTNLAKPKKKRQLIQAPKRSKKTKKLWRVDLQDWFHQGRTSFHMFSCSIQEPDLLASQASWFATTLWSVVIRTKLNTCGAFLKTMGLIYAYWRMNIHNRKFGYQRQAIPAEGEPCKGYPLVN